MAAEGSPCLAVPVSLFPKFPCMSFSQETTDRRVFTPKIVVCPRFSEGALGALDSFGDDQIVAVDHLRLVDVAEQGFNLC